MKPLVSVVLCSYNQAAYLPAAIESVLAQTYPRWELLVVDNGSTDRTSEALAGYAGHEKMRLLAHDDNAAVTQRLNQALALAQGEYVSLLYGDDYYLPHKLERQVACFDMLPREYGVVYGPGYRLYQRTGLQCLVPSVRASGEVLKDLLLRRSEGFVVPVAPLFRRACWERYPFHEDLFIEGEMAYLRYALRWRFQYLDEPLVVMRDHEQSAGQQVQTSAERILRLIDKLAQEADFPQGYGPYLQVYKAELFRDLGWMGLRVFDEPVLARQMLGKALAYDPRVIASPRVVGGALLSLLPRRALRGLNRWADTFAELRRTLAQADPHEAPYVERAEAASAEQHGQGRRPLPC